MKRVRITISEEFGQWLAWRLPKWLVYWAGIRLWAHATTGKYENTESSEITMSDTIKRWEK